MLISFTPDLFTFLYFLTFYETQYGNLGELDWIPSPSLFSCVTRSRVAHTDYKTNVAFCLVLLS